MLRKLAAYRRHNQLDLALQEHRQLVASGLLNLRHRQWKLGIYCQPTLQISDQISNFRVLEALCSAAVT
jgi:hypothetical protein